MAVGPCAALRDLLLRIVPPAILSSMPRDRLLTQADIRAPTQAKVLVSWLTWATTFASNSASEQFEHEPQQTNTAWRSGA